MAKLDSSQIKTPDMKFFCPLGSCIMWWKDLIYKECPLVPSHRDMPECKDCQLKIDKEWERNKESWKDKPVNKRRPKKKARRKKNGHQG